MAKALKYEKEQKIPIGTNDYVRDVLGTFIFPSRYSKSAYFGTIYIYTRYIHAKTRRSSLQQGHCRVRKTRG